MNPQPISIGWASIDITPDRPVQIHGQMHERISEFVHDPLTATALALEANADDEAEQAILISCDLVNIGRDMIERLRQNLGERIPGFQRRKLLVNATHTHTGPVMMENLYTPPKGVMTPTEYADLFFQRVSDAAVQAWKAKRPSGISHALGHAAIGFNRRVVYRDGSAKMYGSSDDENFVSIEGGMDPGVELLFTWDAEAKLTGVVVNLACPSQVVESKTFLSADFWHPAREEIRRRLGDDLFVYPMCGAAGDQSPRDLVRRNRGEPSMRDIEGMNEHGRRLALAVEDAFQNGQTSVQRESVFKHITDDLSLPRRKATAGDVEAAQQELERLNSLSPDEVRPSHQRMVGRAKETIERFETQGEDPCYVADIHVMRLGDIAIATNPFELFLDYGLQMKARSKAQQTFVTQITNDRGIYLPTEKAIRGGSYGAGVNDNIVGPEGGNILVKRTIELINGMWE
jgi:hypothetical protein